MSKLQQAIEQLYEVFADVQKPHHIDACPCCCDNKKIDILLSKSLRELTADDLSAYASSVFCTVGCIDDYLYFLPRILEITATQDSWWPDPEVTARAICDAQLNTWSAQRRAATKYYIDAVFETAIESDRYYILDSWLCATARMGIDVIPYLKLIEKSPQAVLAVFEDNAETLPLNKLRNSFWELPSAGHDAIVDWLNSAEIKKIPYEAYGYVMPDRK